MVGGKAMTEAEVLTEIRHHLAEVDRLAALLLQRQIEADQPPRCETCQDYTEDPENPGTGKCSGYWDAKRDGHCDRWWLREVKP